MVPALLADGFEDERQALERITPWLRKIAPRKLAALVSAIKKHVPDHLQKSVLRRYIKHAQALMGTPDATPECIHDYLDRAVKNVRTLFKRNDPIWNND